MTNHTTTPPTPERAYALGWANGVRRDKCQPVADMPEGLTAYGLAAYALGQDHGKGQWAGLDHAKECGTNAADFGLNPEACPFAQPETMPDLDRRLHTKFEQEWRKGHIKGNPPLGRMAVAEAQAAEQVARQGGQDAEVQRQAAREASAGFREGYLGAVACQLHLFSNLPEHAATGYFGAAWRRGIESGLKAKAEAHRYGADVQSEAWVCRGRLIDAASVAGSGRHHYPHCEHLQAAFARGIAAEAKAIVRRLRKREHNRRRYAEERNAGWRMAQSGGDLSDCEWSPTSALGRAWQSGYRAWMQAHFGEAA